LQGCVRYLLDHRLAIIMEPDIFNNDPDVIEIVPDGRADVALPIEEMEAKTMPIAARDKKRKS